MSTGVKVGDRIPSVKVVVSQNETEANACALPKVTTTADLLQGKIVLFAVPGAFTPTCHLQHLPGFVQHYKNFVEKGYKLFCMSTNDIFVLDAWGKANGASGKITMIADGNGEFAESLGAGLDLSAKLMGNKRTVRFGLVAVDGVITYFEKGELDKSGAEAILAKI